MTVERLIQLLNLLPESATVHVVDGGRGADRGILIRDLHSRRELSFIYTEPA